MGETYIWLVVLVLLLIAEALTVQLTTIWFAGGALVAAVAAWLGAGLPVQLILFFIVSFVLLLFTRPLAMKSLRKGTTRTNVDSLIGQKAVVTQRIDNLAQTGQVRINDIEWMARAVSDDIMIPEKAVVVIREVRGVKLIVSENKED